MIIIYIVFAILLYISFYFLGKILCKKIKFLSKNSNKTSVIILSIILIPLGMAVDNEVLAYGIGFALAPFLGTTIIHFLVRAISKKTLKKQPFYNKEYYYGFVGTLILSYISLLLPTN